MTYQYLTLRGLDTLLFGDGRPFTDEEGAQSARSLPLPYPGTVAGFVRTTLGEQKGWKWTLDEVQQALATPIAGSILMRNEAAVFPAPADALVFEEEKAEDVKPGEQSKPLRCVGLKPAVLAEGEGCDSPVELLPLLCEEQAKPAPGYHYWTSDDLERWLLSAFGRDETPEKIGELPLETRTHVALNSKTGTAEDAKLYSVQSRAFNESAYDEKKERWHHYRWSLGVRVETDHKFKAHCGSLGGEQRLAALDLDPQGGAIWACPDKLKTALATSSHLRMMLTTPAIFAGGWKPDWLDENLVGSPPSVPALKLKLVSAAVPRRQAVSGWDYVKRKPKPVRWLAPAGSVYFFEVVGGTPSDIAETLWLQPVSDAAQDRRDGYGLALWGIWNPAHS